MGENLFERAVEFVLSEEGGLVNNPADPGGVTKYGISQRSYPTLDIPKLTQEDAKAIYKRDYWNKVCGEELPPGIGLLVFDSAVDQGVGVASRLLQSCLNVYVDGAIKPLTADAARLENPEKLAVDFCARRALRYAQNRNVDTFGRGWFRRLFRAFAEARKML